MGASRKFVRDAALDQKDLVTFMAISYASNADSVRVQRRVAQSSAGLSRTYERLSSGLRINHASDDAAGLAVADDLRADAKIATVAIRNANDGISITGLAGDALDEIQNILARMYELGQQSANGAYTNTQRSALSSEFVALGSEIDRIAKTTSFNSRNLLSASSDVTIQVGLTGATNSTITIAAISGTLAALGLSSSGGSALVYSITGTSVDGATNAANNAVSAVQFAMNSLTSFRGTIAAAESRLSVAVDYLAAARETFINAESKIRDADVAQEVAEMVRFQVLQQAGMAVLAQANQQPEVVLALLR